MSVEIEQPAGHFLHGSRSVGGRSGLILFSIASIKI
jgi:hypothetical protein